jgi:hypothetical protein
MLSIYNTNGINILIMKLGEKACANTYFGALRVPQGDKYDFLFLYKNKKSLVNV